MTDTPEAIAARLSAAQKRALLWLPADGSCKRRVEGRPPSYQSMSSIYKAVLCSSSEWEVYRITPLGASVRAVLEAQKP